MIVLAQSKEISKDQMFIDLFNNHWNEVYQLCLKYTRDHATALDLSQNIFLSVWDRNLKFSSSKDTSSYLLKAAKYQVLNYWRNKKHTIDISEDISVGKLGLNESLNPEDLLIGTEARYEVKRQIAHLKEPTRTIFLLSREEEMSYRQIAQEMNVGIKTVEKHISRALRTLRERLSVRL